MKRNYLVLAAALTLPGVLIAQTPAQTPAAAAKPATDSAAQADARAKQVTSPRAAWLSDRLGIRVGDLITIVVNEATAASEQVSNNASTNRSQRAQLGIGVDPANILGPAKDFSTGLTNSSGESGQSGRSGNLTSVLTVRVTNIDASGIASVEGNKTVTVDGRNQVIQLKGLVRTEDISANNTVLSNRIADAAITYNGKKVSPKSGILGKILSIFWP